MTPEFEAGYRAGLEAAAKVAKDMADKYGNPNGTPYEQGSQDMAARIHGKLLALTPPSDMVMVPREPTEAMLAAVTAADQHEPFSFKTMRGIYCSMIGAVRK